MAKIVSLFDSQLEATKALDALGNYDYGDIETEVIESPAETAARTDDVVPIVPIPHLQDSGTRSGVGFLPSFDNLGLGEEEAEFFRRGVQNGGILVTVEVDEEYEEAVEELLHNFGGRTAVG